MNDTAKNIHEILNEPLDQEIIERINNVIPSASHDISLAEITDDDIRAIRDHLNNRQHNAIASTTEILFMMDLFVAMSLQGIRPNALFEIVIRIYPHHAESILTTLESRNNCYGDG